MGLREAQPAIAELKRQIQKRYPGIEIKRGPGFEGGPEDIYLYPYAPEKDMDDIIEMSSPRVLKILLKTGILVHVIPLRPGTMTWLWDNAKKRKTRRPARALAESRATYKVSQHEISRRTKRASK